MPKVKSFMGLVICLIIHLDTPVSIVRTSPLKRGGLILLIVLKKISQVLGEVVNFDLFKISVVDDRLS